MLAGIEAVKEIVKANASEVYKDAAQPSVRVVGKTLAQCVSLFSTPIGRTAEILEKNIHKYLDKLDGIPEVDIVPPNTRVLVPILEKFRYTDEEKVSDYYAEILAAASRKETAQKVFLTFIEILNRLTADELKILEFISSPKNTVQIDNISEEDRVKFGIPASMFSLQLSASLPVIEIRLKQKKTGGYNILRKNFNDLNERVNLNNPENIDSYLDNLISLGLLEKPYGVNFAFSQVYKHLEESETVQKMKNVADKELENIECHKEKLNLTDLGAQLLKFAPSSS